MKSDYLDYLLIAFQLNRLADLEEIVAEQDKKLADSRQSFDRAKNELENIREANAVELKLQRKKFRLYVLIINADFSFCTSGIERGNR